MTYQTQHAKVVRLEVSIGKDLGEDERVIEDFIEAIRQALTTNPEVGAHNVTVQGAYYILDGKVCRPDDYDPETKNRKPGTYPPPWAGGPTEARPSLVAVEAEDDGPREFVRVPPTRTNERHADGRRVRRDKGVKRGPKAKPPEREAS